ncbi:MAG: MotA/TolQ/ExbB proton channel family protein [Gammaproteobacteria bacterium]|nr:MotA/TolQ/ExbB proton channel family protein [Gammaproteobacteria bacterium]
MNTVPIETLMYQVSGLLLPPVLLIITLLFFYALFIFGCFSAQYLQRSNNVHEYQRSVHSLMSDNINLNPVNGYRLFNHYQKNPSATEADLEIFALKLLEKQRIVTRVAPMLGLVATMIPMGPALKALADGNIQGISENLVIAFAAVILGLVTASITFWTASVKKRWLVSELIDLQHCIK